MARAKIVVDARWLHTGLGAYILDLLAGLHLHREDFFVRAVTRRQHVARLEPYCEEVKILDTPIYTLREQFQIPWAARGAAILHVPHYNAPLFYMGKLVVTIHDVIHLVDERPRHGLARRLYAHPMLNLVARKACHIITVSHHSKAQIVERLSVPPSKVTVIHRCVNAHFRCLDREEARGRLSRALSVRWPYVLYVGNLKPHKNVAGLIQAFAVLRNRGLREHQLLIVGDDRRGKQEVVQEISRLRLDGNVSLVAHVSDDLMPPVYAAADLLVLPSFIEGFGLPVLEAMASGTPVACSRAGSLPEVAGNAAEYFDPASVEEMATAIQRVLESQDRRDTLRRKGLEQAGRFSRDEFTQQHVNVYRSVLGT